ncbi:MAG TPA: NAD-dependent epimerase/dehydratase family protein [Gemmatimonadota bacterium]|nr:NAD-dependent epimerase/dehydratase family protein [Gemmatimonadota bacterium]
MTDPRGPGSGQPVLVTGGSGFVGGYLVENLVADGYAVRALARPGADTQRLERIATVVRGDLSDVDALERAATGCSRVFHVAAVTSTSARSKREYEATNVAGPANVAIAAARAGVERLVHVSSCGVYGFRCPSPADESAPLAPDTPYRRSKAGGERAVMAAAERSGLAVVIARLSSVYGPRARNWVRICRTIQEGRFRMIGDGRNRVHLVHVDDIVAGLRACADTPGIEGRPFNLAGPAPISMGELVDTLSRALEVESNRARWPAFPFRLARLFDLTAAHTIGHRPRRLGSYDLFLADRCFDITQARIELGYQPRVSAEEGMARLALHYRAEGLLRPD